MKKSILFLISIVLLITAGCGQKNKEEIPADVIPREQMIDIMVDAWFMESVIHNTIKEYERLEPISVSMYKEFFEEHDIHIHVPEGAVPKDGPSAGVTLTTAIVSAITKTPVNSNIAMTGEVTLRGNVLPIGGLKEKSLAAHRSGIKKIIIPKGNVKDLDELPSVVKESIEFVPCDKVDNVIKEAFVK